MLNKGKRIMLWTYWKKYELVKENKKKRKFWSDEIVGFKVDCR